MSGGLHGGEDPAATSKVGAVRLEKFVNAFIDFSKPLIAAVNGPAFGIAVTTLALCDIVYAAESAKFTTPFMSLGQSPEGVSSILFARLMGSLKANELLMMGKPLNAHEAERRNLVAGVLPNAGFYEEVLRRAEAMAKFPAAGLRHCKKLIRDPDRALFKAANHRECALLEKLWVSEDCLNAIAGFMQQQLAKAEQKAAAAAGSGGDRRRARTNLQSEETVASIESLQTSSSPRSRL